jgi:hypothetical protein
VCRENVGLRYCRKPGLDQNKTIIKMAGKSYGCGNKFSYVVAERLCLGEKHITLCFSW